MTHPRRARALALVASLAVGAGSCSGDDTSPAVTTERSTTTEPAALAVDEAATVGGLRVTVIGAGAQPTVSDTEGGGYVVIGVQVENTTATAVEIAASDWTLEPSNESSIEAASTSVRNSLATTALAPRASLTAKVVFEVGLPPEGTYVAVFTASDGERARWSLDLPSS